MLRKDVKSVMPAYLSTRTLVVQRNISKFLFLRDLGEQDCREFSRHAKSVSHQPVWDQINSHSIFIDLKRIQKIHYNSKFIPSNRNIYEHWMMVFSDKKKGNWRKTSLLSLEVDFVDAESVLVAVFVALSFCLRYCECQELFIVQPF